ncbi:MAG: VOC family protein [Bacteroidota bacterium]
MKLKSVHHIAIICSDYPKSKQFYTQILGFQVKQEIYREERNSYKLDLTLNEIYVIELFSFPNPKPRPTQPEATGLRHIAFGVENIEEAVIHLMGFNVVSEPIRIDEFTGKLFTFFKDPDDLPIELYQL